MAVVKFNLGGEQPGWDSEPGESNPAATRRPASVTNRLVMPGCVKGSSRAVICNPTNRLRNVPNSIRPQAPEPGVGQRLTLHHRSLALPTVGPIGRLCPKRRFGLSARTRHFGPFQESRAADKQLVHSAGEMFISARRGPPDSVNTASQHN